MELPKEWHVVRSAADHHTVPVIISLAQRNMSELTKVAMAVSDPKSPSYKHYLTNDQVKVLTSPPSEVVARVMAWLGDTAALQGDGATITASPSVREAELLFSTEISSIFNHATGQTRLRAAEFSVPTVVRNDITSVFGLHGLPLPLEIASFAPPKPPEPPAVTPAVLKKYYGA
jgi:subtilase family serine protease